MDKKYVKGGVVVLPHLATAKGLATIADHFKDRYGFVLSKSDVVVYLVNKELKEIKTLAISKAKAIRTRTN